MAVYTEGQLVSQVNFSDQFLFFFGQVNVVTVHLFTVQTPPQSMDQGGRVFLNEGGLRTMGESQKIVWLHTVGLGFKILSTIRTLSDNDPNGFTRRSNRPVLFVLFLDVRNQGVDISVPPASAGTTQPLQATVFIGIVGLVTCHLERTGQIGLL